MAASESVNDHIESLRRELEDLALQTVLCGPEQAGASFSSGWSQTLAEIATHAAGAGRAELAAQASRLQERLAALATDPAALLEVARTEIQNLQAACEQPNADAQPALQAASLAQDQELIADFIMESREHLQNIEQNVLALEQDPNSADAIHSIFRAFHTIKGIAGFLELNDVRDVAHETETLLDQVRAHELEMSAAVIDAILESADYLGREVRRIEAGGVEPPAPKEQLLEMIRQAGLAAPEPCIEPVAAEARQPEPQVEAVPVPKRPAAGPVPAVEQPAAPKAASKSAVFATAIKVDTSKLDYLINMVGEMVIAQSLVRHNPDMENLRDSALMRNMAQLSRVTGEVQKAAMSMRMAPTGILFQKMARLVRDLSRKAGKQAELVTSGNDTDLDRNILEELHDPLMHMVRNAIDHGVEPPEQRIARGKPAMARIELRAMHQGGHIVLEISDDGRGMDREAILRKARDKGLVSHEAALSDNDVYQLIFEPGFSTAESVTDISGRGVGMDVVKRHVQKLRGRITVETRPGVGSTFRLHLPLTLAIIDGLIAGVGEERYIVPIFAVKELVRPDNTTVSTIEGRREIAMIRDRALPVVRLHRRFGVTPRTEDPLDSLLIVTESQGKEYCLMVDSLLGKQEVVIKSLGETFHKVPGIAGGAILGDGRVGLILDMNGLFTAQRAA